MGIMKIRLLLFLLAGLIAKADVMDRLVVRQSGNITNVNAVSLSGSLTNVTLNGLNLRDAIPVGSLTSATILGDSITQGSAASASGTRWHQLVTAATGWAGTQIGAWGGARIEDIAWQAMPGIIVTNSDYSPTTIYTSPTNITEDDVLLALVGYNDQRGGGTVGTRSDTLRRGGH